MITGERGKLMSFSEKILYLRTRNGMSQEVLADKLSVSRQAVSKWESGVTLPETDKSGLSIKGRFQGAEKKPFNGKSGQGNIKIFGLGPGY